MCLDKIGSWTQNSVNVLCYTTRCKFMYKLEFSHQTLCHIVELGEESNNALQSTR